MILCVFCNKKVSDVEAAISEGWYPSWHAFTGLDGRSEEYSCPVCQDCLEENFTFDGPGGDPIMIQGREKILLSD
jgi:hypothetical protein